MSRLDWCRNTDWNESIEQVFEEKLRRARHKHQYLRIQANILSGSHPAVALRLLERYFALDKAFDWALACCDQASAFLSLGRIDEAITAYERALDREAEFPTVKTRAYLDLPFLIATRTLSDRFDRALQILGEHRSQLTFPVDRFMWHAAFALIANCRCESSSASDHASRALIEATRLHSGFQAHPTVGLVSQPHQRVIDELTAIIS